MRSGLAGRLGAWRVRLLAGALALGVAGIAHASDGAQAVKLRFGGDAASTRVVLELDRAAKADVISDGADDGHVVLSFSSLKVGDDLDGRGQGIVKSWSLARDMGHTRLSLDLKGRGKVRRRFLLPPSDGVGVYRYVLDIEPAGPAAAAPMSPPMRVAAAPAQRQASSTAQYASAPASMQMTYKVQKASLPVSAPTPVPSVPDQGVRVWPPAAAAADGDPEAPEASQALTPPPTLLLPEPAPIRASRQTAKEVKAVKEFKAVSAADTATKVAAVLTKKVIVIDAGHGGHDPGALGGASHEKDLTLAAAKALRARLERTGRFKVVMTRDSDVYIPLESRVTIARSAGADLFISLHADSGSDPKAKGATVYTLSDHGVDRTAKSVFGGGFMNVQLPGRDLSVKQILLDLTQRTTRNRSGAFAETLLEHISTRTELLRRSHRDAGYMVLLAPDVPAVLMEMGFITNPDDENHLNDPKRRARLMDAVGDAIESYFAEPVQVASR